MRSAGSDEKRPFAERVCRRCFPERARPVRAKSGRSSKDLSGRAPASCVACCHKKTALKKRLCRRHSSDCRQSIRAKRRTFNKRLRTPSSPKRVPRVRVTVGRWTYAYARAAQSGVLRDDSPTSDVPPMSSSGSPRERAVCARIDPITDDDTPPRDRIMGSRAEQRWPRYACR